MAGVLSLIAYGLDKTQPVNLYTGVVLLAIVIFTSTLSYIEEAKSGNIMAKFKNMLPPFCKVIRDGKEKQVKA